LRPEATAPTSIPRSALVNRQPTKPAATSGRPASKPGAAIEARFVPAVQRLKTLTKEHSVTSDISAERGRDWSSIFDETVPDELELVVE
jgi:hypothetical protein